MPASSPNHQGDGARQPPIHQATSEKVLEYVPIRRGQRASSRRSTSASRIASFLIAGARPLRVTDNPRAVALEEQSFGLLRVGGQHEARARPLPEHGVHRREELAVVLGGPIGAPKVAPPHVNADGLAQEPRREHFDALANRGQG